jgi:4-amino-4-deoxy-L-arabinose transferase-like glycosyltransferase
MRSSAPSVAFALADQSDGRWRDMVAVVILVAGVSAIYGARLTLPPLVGEETRWATAARDMLVTGDWMVPRQQGQVFPERPPMTMWAMAALGQLRGDVDPLAVRLPSVVAVVLTTLLIYAYVRSFSSVLAAFVAAIAYATMGQVLQIGRLGESEALFALFVSASLLIWHLGYMRTWPPLLTWMAGFASAALAALVKGPQAPVYFVAITSVYLAWRRDWRYLFSWQCAAGAAVFLFIIALWQIPFYTETNWSAVVATWSGLAADRIHLRGVLSHVFTYPVETFVCLLPWSPILVALAKRETRSLLLSFSAGDSMRTATVFLIVALLVAYPTVWLAAGARGRYFMPLYPLIAILVGLVIERCSLARTGTYPRRAWHQFLLLWGTFIGASGLLIGVTSLLSHRLSVRYYQPRSFGLAYAVLAAIAAYLIWSAYRRAGRFASLIAVAAIAAIAGVGAAGILMNVNVARWIDPTTAVAELKDELPLGTKLVSLSPIDHRFAYYYGDAIAELKWPRAIADLPNDVNYFCFMRQPGDTAEARKSGRGRTEYKTPGTVPFAWEEVTSICVERQVHDNKPQMVVLGRVVRPLRATISDVTKPENRKVGAAHQSMVR